MSPRRSSSAARRVADSVALLLVLLVAGCGGRQAAPEPAWSIIGASDSACDDALLASWEASARLDEDAAFRSLTPCLASEAGQALAAMQAEALLREAPWYAAQARQFAGSFEPSGWPARVFTARIEERLAELEHQETASDGWLDRSAVGAASVWRTIGPLSSFEVLEFDDIETSGYGAVLPLSVELPSGPVHAADALPGAFGGVEPAGAQSGIYLLESWIDAGSGGQVVAVVDATTAIELAIDDDVVLRRGPEDVWRERLIARRIALGPGVHRVRVKLAADGSRTFRLQWVSAGDATLTFPETGDGPGSGASPLAPRTRGAEGWLRVGNPAASATLALAVGDVGAVAALDGAPLPAIARAALASARHDLPPAVRTGAVLDALRSEGEPETAPPGVAARVADVLLGAGRASEAPPWVATALRRAPDSAAAVGVAAREAERNGWEEQEWERRRRLAVLAPSDCRNAARVADLLLARAMPVRAAEWPTEWLQCDAFALAVVDYELYPIGDRAGAHALLERLARRSPMREQLLLRWARAAATQGDEAARNDALALLRRFSALDVSVLGFEIDAAVARGDEAFARDASRLLQTLDPGDLFAREAIAVATGEGLLERWRIDGRAAALQYAAEVAAPSADVVLVLDASTSVFTTEGTRVDIVHQVAQLNTRDALDAFGEAGVPGSALLLNARTIKPDGRVLVPEDISGEDALSMPGLEVGDFIELEWAETVYGPLFEAPANRTERFFFRGFDGVFHRSVTRFVVPSALADRVVYDVRNFEGTREREIDGDLVIETFEVRDSQPARPDPVGPTPAAWLPSVRAAVAYPVEVSERMFRDALEKLVDLPDHLAAEVRAELDGVRGDRARVRRVHRIVVDETVDAGSFFRTPAAWGWTSGEGERLTLMVGMLRAAGYAPDVVFVRPFEQDPTDAAFDDLGVYDLTAVRVPTRDGDIWLEPDFDRYPFDFLRLEAQGQQGIVIAGPNAGQRVETPTWPDVTRRNEIDIRIAVQPDGSAEVEIAEQIPLRLASGVRSFVQSEEDERTVARELEIAVSGSFPGIEGLELEIDGLDDREGPVQMRYRFTSRGLFRPQSDGTWVRDGGIFERPLAGWYAARPSRERPLVVSVPLFERMEVRWELPDGGTFVRIPADERYTYGDSAFERTSEERGSVLTTTRLTELPLQRVAAEEYPDFASFLRGWEDGSRAEVRATW